VRCDTGLLTFFASALDFMRRHRQKTRGVDQRHMRQGLREVAEHAALARVGRRLPDAKDVQVLTRLLKY